MTPWTSHDVGDDRCYHWVTVGPVRSSQCVITFCPVNQQVVCGLQSGANTSSKPHQSFTEGFEDFMSTLPILSVIMGQWFFIESTSSYHL